MAIPAPGLTNLLINVMAPPRQVPAKAFADVLQETLAILDDLQHVHSPKKLVTWYITDLQMGSAKATITAEDISDTSHAVGLEFVVGLRSAEEGRALPDHFPQASLTRLAKLSKPLSYPGIEYFEASIGSNGSQVTARATKVIKSNLDRLQIPRRESFGSITGVLDTISTRTPAKFQILDPVSRRPVSCQFAPEQIDAMKDALSKRVTVRGIIVRNISGQPLRVKQGEVEVLPESLPLTNLIGVDADYTGGLSLPDYFDRIS